MFSDEFLKYLERELRYLIEKEIAYNIDDKIHEYEEFNNKEEYLISIKRMEFEYLLQYFVKEWDMSALSYELGDRMNEVLVEYIRETK